MIAMMLKEPARTRLKARQTWNDAYLTPQMTEKVTHLSFVNSIDFSALLPEVFNEFCFIENKTSSLLKHFPR
jgi:hypothetical protein